MGAADSFFATRLRDLRAASGLSQAELSKASGVGLTTIRKFEYGLREPTFGTLVKLARGLRVGLGQFEPHPHEMVDAADTSAAGAAAKKPPAAARPKPRPRKGT